MYSITALARLHIYAVDAQGIINILSPHLSLLREHFVQSFTFFHLRKDANNL